MKKISASKSSEWHSNQIVVLGFILLVATILRLLYLDKLSLWFDELHSIIPTDPSHSFLSVVEYAKSDQPPLFFIMLYGWFKVFPYNEVSGKVFCALIGLLGVFSMYFLGKEYHEKKTGLVAASLTAVNLFHIYYSQELRFYSLLFVTTVLSFLFFKRFVKKQNIPNQILFVLTSCAVLYTHYFGMVVMITQALIFIFIALFYRRGTSFFLKGLTCGLFILLLFSPWLPTVFRDNETSSFWIEDPGIFFFIEYFTRYFNGWWGLSFKPVLSLTLFIAVVSFIFYFFRDIRENRDEHEILSYILIIGWAFLTLLIPYVYTVVKLPMIVDRYTIITLPAILLMIAIGWVRLSNIYLSVALTIIFVVFTWRADHRYFSRYLKPQYRELSAELIRQNSEKQPVLSAWAWQFNYFFRKYHAGYEVLNMDEAYFEEWLANQDAFWVIFPQDHLTENRLRLVNLHFEKSKDLEFHGASASFFKRK